MCVEDMLKGCVKRVHVKRMCEERKYAERVCQDGLLSSYIERVCHLRHKHAIGHGHFRMIIY